MDTQTLKRLEEAGFVPTTVAEFVGLSPAEAALVETRARFTPLLKQTRTARGWTQAQLARALGTRQQTIARAERGGSSVSLDFLLRALLTAGLSLSDVGDELSALDAALQPAAVTGRHEAPGTVTRTLSRSNGNIAAQDKGSHVAPEKACVVSPPAAPLQRRRARQPATPHRRSAPAHSTG